MRHFQQLSFALLRTGLQHLQLHHGLRLATPRHRHVIHADPRADHAQHAERHGQST